MNSLSIVKTVVEVGCTVFLQNTVNGTVLRLVPSSNCVRCPITPPAISSILSVLSSNPYPRKGLIFYPESSGCDVPSIRN